MALYLVQHAKSLPGEQDPDQGLSEEGLAEVKRIAGVAAGYGVRPLAIRHSGRKERSRQPLCSPKRFCRQAAKPSLFQASVLSMMSLRLQALSRLKIT